MAAIDFPNSPSNGNTHTANGITWTYDGGRGVWKASTFSDAPKGEKGQKGQKGQKGDQGQKGATGSTGAKGDTGGTGAKGNTGSKGQKGEVGATPSGNVTFDNVYSNAWFRNNNSGQGLYNTATTQHFYSDGDDWWNIAGGTGANGIRFRDESAGTARNALYSTQSSDIGFLNSAMEWAIRSRLPDGESPNLYFVEGTNTTWPDNPGDDTGLIAYHQDAFYITSGNNSGRIVNFTKNTTTAQSYVDNSGVYNGTATSARWADLAERYAADKVYPCGTVLAIGGDKEVTEYKHGMPLAGAVSTNPGVRMNNHFEIEEADSVEAQLHPYVALSGRIPVLINGSAKKGDYIIADDNGRGKAVPIGLADQNSMLVIGIALEDGEGEVEVKV